MKLYHGTQNKSRLEAIKRNGFLLNDGHYGFGIYCFDDPVRCLDYAHEEDEETGHSDLVIMVSVPDENILELKYREAAEKFGIWEDFSGWKYYNSSKNIPFDIAEPIPMIKDFVMSSGYGILRMVYSDCSEYVIYDKELIKIQ